MESGTKILGVDFGLKRVGLAVCDSLHILATPLPVVYTKSMRTSIDRVAAAAKEQCVGGIVVGLPLNLDGSESVQSGRARAFARNLGKVTGLPVELFDERLTTVEADELLIEAGVTKAAERAKLIDSMAAKVILQGYIDNNNGRK
ncbi:MAG: Holliday junction resolvase RuvX [Clostridia bacterium]|nr:Holliday junction resolvase RuvX [Clostridia bacterium]